MSEETKTAFNQGYLIACANIVHLHDEGVVAEDVLSELGITRSQMEAAMKGNDFDLPVVRKLYREIERKLKIAQRRIRERQPA